MQVNLCRWAYAGERNRRKHVGRDLGSPARYYEVNTDRSLANSKTTQMHGPVNASRCAFNHMGRDHLQDDCSWPAHESWIHHQMVVA